MSQERITKALTEHQPKTGIRDLHRHCTCGWFGKPLASDFIAHQAEMLAPLIAAEQAEVWSEGHESGFWNGRESAGHHEMRYVGLEHAQRNNPYRERNEHA